MRTPPPELRQFLEAYDPSTRRLFFTIRKVVLAHAPDANELIYDAYNAVAASYSFTDRFKEAFCHIATYRDHVNLGFNRGAALKDPEGLLVGSGTHIRHIRIDDPQDLQRRSVEELVQAAVGQGRKLGSLTKSRPRSVVRAVYATKRRPAAKP